MRNALVIFGALSLVGCATVEEMRTQEPIFSGLTAKEPAVYGACIMEKWRGMGISPDYSPIPEGVEILVESGVGPTDFVLRAVKQEGESQTYVRLGARGSLGTGKLINAAKQCM